MSARKTYEPPRPHRLGEAKPERARDAQPVIDPGYELNMVETVPATEKEAHVDHRRSVHKERILPTKFFITIIGVAAGLAVVLSALLWI